MSQLMRPGTGSHNDRNFSTANPASLRNQVPRTAPASRVNLPFDPRQHQQYTQHQLQQIQQQRQQKIEQQHMQRPLTVADECRPSDSNYTSQPLRYQLPDMNLTVPIIRDAQGLHTQHPVCGRPDLGLRIGRDIASDMMEAMFLGDPGYFFQLNEGVKYYIWRRTLLKLQGTHALIGRLFPHMPVFNFDFRTTFRDIGPRGVPYVVTPHIRRGTYDYFYSCWRRRMFPSSQDDRQEPNNSEHQSNNPNHDKSFENFLIKAKFWDSFDPRVKENSAEGLRLRNAVIRNLIVHLDIAGQRLQKREFKDKDDAIAYIEASVEFWGNPEWQFPEDFVPTPDQHKRLQHAGQIYPYAIAIDKQVKGREPRIRPNARSPPEDNRPVWQVQLEQAAANVAADNGSLIRAVTKEEADFMDYLFDYDYEPEPEPEPEPELEQLDAEVSAQERELLRDTTGNPRFPSDLVMMDSILD